MEPTSQVKEVQKAKKVVGSNPIQSIFVVVRKDTNRMSEILKSQIKIRLVKVNKSTMVLD